MMSNTTMFFWVIIIFVICLFIFFPGPANNILDDVLGRDPVIVVNNPPPAVVTPPAIIPNTDTEPTITSSDHFSVANWNLQIFGISKAAEPELMNDYAAIISNYDIVFIQEIRDISEVAFPQLCSLLNGYTCEISSRAGRSSSKEQYGIIYRDNIELVSVTDYNPDSLDRWERPPIKADFIIDGYELSIYNLHSKPTDVQMELRGLQNIVSNTGNELIIGDLNADCSYYDAYYGTEFDDWNWVIGDDEDTTVSTTNCAYDRIIFNDEAYEEYYSSGILREGITSSHSDHYLVWTTINKEEAEQ